jgi:vesicle-fusing ATPase
MSIIIIDDLDALVDFNPIGPRYNLNMVSFFRSIVKRKPPIDRKRAIIATTSDKTALDQLRLSGGYKDRAVPNISSWEEVWTVMKESKLLRPDSLQPILQEIRASLGEHISIGVDPLLQALSIGATSRTPAGTILENLESARAQRVSDELPQQYGYAT